MIETSTGAMEARREHTKARMEGSRGLPKEGDVSAESYILLPLTTIKKHVDSYSWSIWSLIESLELGLPLCQKVQPTGSKAQVSKYKYIDS